MANGFVEKNGELYVESLPVSKVVKDYGTPLYVYSKSVLVDAYQAYEKALAGKPHQIFYAAKANSNLSLMKLFASMGAGFDIVSGGELARVLYIGADPGKVVFSGVGKTVKEINEALEASIACFNVESAPELDRINEIAVQKEKKAPIALRVNPDVDPKTHPYISTGMEKNKFGLDVETAESLYERATQLPGIEIIGISCHIGSQLTELDPILEAFDKLLGMVDRLAERGIHLKHIDIGGGLGIRYHDETPPTPGEYAQALLNRLGDRSIELWCEPGRSLVGNAGILVTQIEYIKQTPSKTFAIVDAAMNDLMRPTLYDAWHDIQAVDRRDSQLVTCDVVGPICETGDFFARDREVAIKEGGLLAIFSAGAYGSVMASNYNSRARAAGIIVDGTTIKMIRQRETYESMLRVDQVGDAASS